MSNTYRINFEQLRQENLTDIFSAFERALTHLDIDFYLIGALARDTWFAQKGIRALGTKDIDFAVMVSDPGKFHQLKQYMVTIEGFTASGSNEYVLFDPQGFQIDLLPFGSLEIEGREIIDKEGLARTNISGFDEVYQEAVESVIFENRFTFKVSTLPGIVLLKLIAFDDRPEMRIKDIQDIGSILNHYFSLETNLIFEKHADLFEEEKELMWVATRALGREMQYILNRNPLLKERVLLLLYKQIELGNKSSVGKILMQWVDLPQASIEDAVSLLHEIVTGIHDHNHDQPNNAYLQDVFFYRDITNGSFDLSKNPPRYPKTPHSIFSKDFSGIELSGSSRYSFYMIFSNPTGETNTFYVTPDPITSVIKLTREIPLKNCMIRFELVPIDNMHLETAGPISFQLINKKP